MLLPLALAHAAGVSDGLQLRLYDRGLDVARGLVEGQTFTLEYDDVGSEYDCWDYVGVRDLSLDIPIERVKAELDDDVVHLTVEFGEIQGEDWVVYSLDEDYFDTCIEFEFDVLYVSLTDAVLEADLSVKIEGGKVNFAVRGTPSLSGDLDTDVEYFPDDLTLYFFEDEVLAAIAEGVGSYVPGVLSDYVNETVMGGDFGNYAMAFDVSEVSVSPKRLAVLASGAVNYTGTDGCPNRDDGRNDGRSPQIDFDDSAGSKGDSALAIGLTEKMLNEVFRVLWRDGWFCFSAKNIETFLDSLSSAFDPSIAGLSAEVSLAAPPEVRIDKDGAWVSVVGLDILIEGTSKGKAETLLDASLDLSALLDVGVDASQGAFTLSAREVTLDFARFDARHLVSTEAGAEKELKQFIEGWAGGWIESQSQDLVLFSTLYDVMGLVVRVDELGWQEGGVRLYLSVFEEDDPEVDREAPDTDATVVKGAGGGARVQWTGTDDRKGTLAFSWRLDGGSWSGWTTDDGAELGVLEAGSHSVEVQARDAWWNVDPSPVKVIFEPDALPEPEAEEAGCGCGAGAAAGTGAPAAVASLVAALRGRRRRRARAVPQ